MRANRPVRPHEFEVFPRIFCLDVRGSVRGSAAAAALRIAEFPGTAVYYQDIESIFFGFPTASEEQGLAAARSIMEICASEMRFADNASLSVSTLGRKDKQHILSAPWKHLGTEELSEALTCYIRFNSVS